MFRKQCRLLRMLSLLALFTTLALSCPRMALAANTASTLVTLSVSGSNAGGNGGQTPGSGNTGDNGSASGSENTDSNSSASGSGNASGNNNSSAVVGNAGNNTATSDNGNSPSGTTSTTRSGQTHGAKTGDEAPAEILLFFGLVLMSASVIFLVIRKRDPEKHLTSHKNL